MTRKLYLPVGLLLAVGIALLFPAPGVFLKDHSAIPWFVVIIFLVNGYQIKTGEVRLSRRLLITLIASALLSLGIGPILGTGLSRMAGLSTAFALGLVVMSAVPPTLSSGIVITEVSGGNVAWALLMTIVLNGIGVLIVPFSLKLSLASGAEIHIDPLPLLNKLALLVLLPFGVGMLLKRLTHRYRMGAWLRYVPSTCVILTVLASLSSSRTALLETELSRLPVIVICVITVHLLLMALTIPTGKLVGLQTPERKALAFVASQKTLPIAISVLAVLGGETGKALVVCLFFHFTQLIIDSFIAARLAPVDKGP